MVVLGHADCRTPEVLLVAATLPIAIAFFLPSMHERYFYLADVLAVVAAFHRRWMWPVAVIVQACSLMAYAPFLWRTTILPMPVLAGLELVALLGSAAVLVGRLDQRSLRATSPSVALPPWAVPQASAAKQ